MSYVLCVNVSPWQLFWNRLRLLGHSQSSGTLQNLYLVLSGECKIFVLYCYFSHNLVHFPKWFLLKVAFGMQVNHIDSLGCTYRHILADWSSSIVIPEWSLHKVGRCLGYLLIFLHSCKFMLLRRIVQSFFRFMYQVCLGLLPSRSSASISLLQWLLGRWCLAWN